MSSPILSDADLASFRELHESSLPHRARVLVPTMVRSPGGVMVETYPDATTVPPIDCRLQRATSDVIARMQAEQLEAKPLSVCAFALDDVSQEELTLKTRIIVDGETNGAPWTVQLSVIGVEPHRSYQSQRRVLCVPVAE